MVIWFFWNLLISVYAQVPVGLWVDNFYASSSVFVNPAIPASVVNQWEINLISGGLEFSNNYAFLENSSLISLLSARSFAERDPESSTGADAVLDYYDLDSDYFGFMGAGLELPSFLLRIDQQTIGLSYRVRADLYTDDFPTVFGKPAYERRPVYEAFEPGDFTGSGMIWTSWNLSYARSIDLGEPHVDLGITLQRLHGQEAIHLNSTESNRMEKLPGDSIRIFFGQATLAVADRQIGDQESRDIFQPLGYGWGIDLGMQFFLGEHINDYNWKIGLSILDIGRVHFDQRTQVHGYAIEDSAPVVSGDLGTFDDPDPLLEEINTVVYDQRGASLQSQSFFMAMPTALSAQVDYGARAPFYISGMLIYPLLISQRSIRRPKFLAIIPRYAHQKLNIQIPLSWWDMKDFSMGISARFGPFFIGTNRLGSLLLRQNQLDSGDIYFGLKLSDFLYNRARDRYIYDGKQIDCYAF